MNPTLQMNEILEVVEFAKSEVTKDVNPNFIRLYKVYFKDLYPILGENGEVSYGNIIKTAVHYSKEMFNAWIMNAGEIDGFQKGYVAYEVSCAISLIFPSINEFEFFVKLIMHLDLNLKDKGLDTQTILSNL